MNYFRTQDCDACNGTGRSRAFTYGPPVECHACDGTGLTPRRERLVPISISTDEAVKRAIETWRNRQRDSSADEKPLPHRQQRLGGNPTGEPTEEVVTNEKGGKQSRLEMGFHLIPMDVLMEVAAILYEKGQQYGIENWKKLRLKEDNVNHAITHLVKWLSGDRSENHLRNCICRCLFARWQELHTQGDDNP